MLLNVNGINKLNSPTEKTVLYKVPHGYCSGGIKESDVCDTVTASSFQNNNFIIPVLTPDRENKRQMGRRFKNAGDPAFTITTQDRHGISDGVHIRRLTPLECERLQGFPDGWTAEGVDGKRMSDSSRYKALGNAVSVCFPEMIAKALFEE